MPLIMSIHARLAAPLSSTGLSRTAIVRKADPAALAKASKPGSCPKPTTPSEAVALARAQFLLAKFVLMSIPQDEATPYWIQLALANNIGIKGQTQVWVDHACPVVLTSIDGGTRTAAETFEAVVHPLAREPDVGPLRRGDRLPDRAHHASGVCDRGAARRSRRLSVASQTTFSGKKPSIRHICARWPRGPNPWRAKSSWGILPALSVGVLET
jgi:purine nucleoside permease